MRTTFKDSIDAVRAANYNQQGGKSCALIISSNYITVCSLDEVEKLAREGDHVEYFKASPDSQKTSSR